MAKEQKPTNQGYVLARLAASKKPCSIALTNGVTIASCTIVAFDTYTVSVLIDQRKAAQFFARGNVSLGSHPRLMTSMLMKHAIISIDEEVDPALAEKLMRPKAKSGD